ncbi:hypothetical protein QPK24_06385 [Paenibacillus polygoni]|uniref:Uncharacterized protein n=1 Tax=Paenibacillus polygoni TaxID=3050112 RepID=A0ABY8X806_9BACL|nr:hypothetical protein [Paenibacillus polygoni]WIV20318.1 hypothetical protein QPK24_06385 [Paenibacillus polygoni]
MATVGLLGMIHDEELRQEYHCTLPLYKEAILDFAPDVICGEVHPLSWKRYLQDNTDKGYWGEPASEYGDLILPLCEEKQIQFIPIDWFELDVWNNFGPFVNLPDDQKNIYELMEKDWFTEQLQTSLHGEIPFNSKEFDVITKQKYAWLKDLNERSYQLRWNIRNQIMVERVRNTYEKYPDKRILCTVGADHNYFFEEELRKDPIEFIYPIR